MNDAPSTARRLLGQVRELREEVALAGEALASRWRPLVADTAFRKSAQNLAHYLVFRRRDLRTLQQALIPLGVSSLGRCEAHVLSTLDSVLATLGVIAGTDPATLPLGHLSELLSNPSGPSRAKRAHCWVRFPPHVQCASW